RLELVEQFELAGAVSPAFGATLTEPEELLGDRVDHVGDERLDLVVQRPHPLRHAQVEHLGCRGQRGHAPNVVRRQRAATVDRTAAWRCQAAPWRSRPWSITTRSSTWVVNTASPGPVSQIRTVSCS